MRRNRAFALLSAIVAARLFALAWAIRSNVARLVQIAATGNVLETNAISGINPEATYQILGRASLLGLGLGAVLAGRALLHVRRHRTGAAGRAARVVFGAPWIVVVAFVAFVGLEVGASRSIAVDGHAHLGIDDDAFISLRFTNNFVRGFGLVYNPNEHVEGYTNFLWVMLMSIPLRLGVSPMTVPAVIFATDFAFVAASATAIMAILRALRCPTWAAFAAAVCFVADCNTVYYAASGLETSLLTLLVTLSVWGIVRSKVTWTFVLLGLLPLARSDGALLTGILTLTALWHFRQRGRSLRALAFTVAIPVVHILFRKSYYGEWFPNTYYLKMLAIHDRLVLGFGGYALRLDWFYGVWALLAAGATFLRRGRAIAIGGLAAFCLQSAYSIFVGGDSFWFVRFVAPTLPLLYMGGARMLGALRIEGRAPARGMTALFAAIAFLVTPVQTAFGKLTDQVPIGWWVETSFVTAEWLSHNVEPGALVTVYPAGCVPFFSPDVSFVDVLGKNDHTIAHQSHYESLAIGHNRFDFGYVYDVRKPDYTFVDRGCFDFEAPFYMTEPERAKLREHDLIHSPAWDYDRTNPTFMDLYSRNAIHIVGAPPVLLGCFLAREGAGVPQFWSKDGHVPRARSLRYVFGGAQLDGRAATAGRWRITPAANGSPAAGTSTGTAVGEGLLDLWMDPTGDLVVDACARDPESHDDTMLTDPSEDPLRVNAIFDAPTTVGGARADCPFKMLHWNIPRATLLARPSATRLAFAASLSIAWAEAVVDDAKPYRGVLEDR